MNDTELIAEVQRRSGFRRHAEAERALRIVLGALSAVLDRAEADAIARALPKPFALIIQKHPDHVVENADELYRRVRGEEHVDFGFAMEHVQAVCSVIADAISPDARLRLARDLPPAFAALFRPREVGDPPEPPAHPPARTTPTLSTGRPASTHPLSESPPLDGAQRESIARRDNPHADSKISSASGLSQERVGRSIASAKRTS